MDLFELYATIGIKMDEFERGLNSAKEKFDSFSGNLSKAGETISNVGGTLTKGVTLPLAGFGTAIIKAGADYEAGMSKVQAISGATEKEMAKLGEEAMRMAAQTKFSTSESAEAYQYMAMAGWDANQMVDGLSGIMLLASASGESLASTSDIVTDALTAFGLKAEDSGRFADVLAAASNSANTNVSMLGESFKYVAPVAGAMGYSVEDVSIALGLMANSGIKASQAGTTLRTAITNMASPTKNMASVMEEYGISLTDADGNMLSLSEIMGQLREKMGGLDEATQASAASMLFGKESMSGMLAIINASEEDFNKLTNAINNSKGTTEEMAAVMNDNAAGAMAMLSSAVNVLFTNLSEFLIPAFTNIVRKLTDVVNWFNQLDAGTQKLILTIAGIAAALGPVLIVVGKVITAISTIGGAIGNLIGVIENVGGAFSGLFSILAANPIAAVIAVVAALTAGLIVLWNTNEGFRDAVGAIWEAITGFFTGAWETIQGVWSAAAEFFSGVWESIQNIFSGVAEFFGGIFTAAFELVQAAWALAVEFFQGIWDGIQSVFEVVSDVLGGFFSSAWDVITAVWEVAVDFFSEIWEGIENVFSVAEEILGGFFSAAWDAIKAVWDTVVDFFTEIADGIYSVFETVTDALGEFFREAWETVKEIWSAAVGFFEELWAAIRDAASAAADFIGSALKQAWEAVQNAWNAATWFFQGIFDSIVGIFSDIGSRFLEIGGSIVDGLMNGISNAWDSFVGWIGRQVGGIVSSVKEMLGIHSPSKVFAGIGENMALGLAAGWDNEYSQIKKDIESGMNFDPKPFGSSAFGGSNGNWWPDTSSGGKSGGPSFYFTFNSPKALSPVEAARESKKAAQQISTMYV